MSDENWQSIARDDEIDAGSLHTIRAGELQLALGRTGDGTLFCLDNRCPHEGYPLTQGYLDDACALTCAWHNWKFDVRDGRCTIGGEDVRAFELRVTDGTIEVDTTPPDTAAEIPRLLVSLLEGVFKNDGGRAIRDGVRLIVAGYPAEHVLVDLACDDALRAEYGTTHVVALAADCARVLERYQGARAMYAVAPVIDLDGDTSTRLPARPTVAAATDAPDDVGELGEALRAAVEDEDAPRAEALLLAGHDRGVPRAVIEDWLWSVLSDHFLDFGHPLIYMVKARELLDRVDGRGAREIHLGMLRGIVFGTREDTLPYMRAYQRRIDSVVEELPSLWAAQDETRRGDLDAVACRDAVLDAARPDRAFDAVLEPLRRGVPADEIARALVGAGAHRLLRFDIAHERDPEVAENWLWATHRFTVASAVRNAVAHFSSPDALRFLFHAVMFLHSGRRMDLPVQHREPAAIGDDTPLGGDPMADVMAAIASKDAQSACAAVRRLLAENEDVTALRIALEDLVLSDPAVRPIVVAHVIKTTFAAFEEYEALAGHPDRAVPLLAAIRFLASPVQERRVHPTVHTSIRWVVDQVVPRKLTQ